MKLPQQLKNIFKSFKSGNDQVATTRNSTTGLFQKEIENLPEVFAIVCLASSIPILLSLLHKNFPASKLPGLYRVLWIVAFVVNVITVQMPGRFDGDASVSAKDGSVTFPWKTIFMPSGWAFAIWGIIYLSELLLTIAVGAFSLSDLGITKAAPFWIAGNLFQSVWCLCFRRRFIQTLWLPTSQLLLGAISLNLAHRELSLAITSQPDFFKRILTQFVRAPLALHTTWLTAASLLNANTWVAVSRLALSTQLAVATASAYSAFLFGAYFTVVRRDPLIGLTAAWALSALSDRTRNRPEVDVGVVAKDALGQTEQVLSAILVVLSVMIPFVSHFGQFTAIAQKVISKRD